jgi:RecA-family ATPase
MTEALPHEWEGRLGEAEPISGVDSERLQVINPAEWAGMVPPPRVWVWDQWMPLLQATLLTGKGGVGKSLLAQQLATCIALGLPFLGKDTRQANALYLTCEDDADELHRRQDAICKALGVEMSDLAGRLFLSPLAGKTGNHLATFSTSGTLEVGNRYWEVEKFALGNSVGFIVLDNASHLMIGDHNDLSTVAAFLGLLNGLALKIEGAVSILHHPNKAGDDWLGSVAWENQVRSRLVMKPSDVDGDTDARLLINPKANYAPKDSRLEFRWHKGAFVRDDDLSNDVHAALNLTIAATQDNSAFLLCLRERTRERRAVSESRSSTFAPSVFVAMPEARGVSKARLEAAMNRLFRIGAIERAVLWRGPDRKDVCGLRETNQLEPEVVAGNTVRETVRGTRETVPELAENCAGDAGSTYTPPKGGTAAAALGQPAKQETVQKC